MSKNVDAVIAALKVALQDAERRGFYECRARVANRWIDQLPWAWTGKWRHLRVLSDILGNVSRDDFIGQVRATIVYMETNRDALHADAASPWPSWLRRKIQANKEDAAPSVEAKGKTEGSKPVKLVKG
jgi:hypothetical protein